MHYPAEVFIELRYRNKDKRYVKALVYAMATFCQIQILLHYLACIWIFIGSDYFTDYEAGYTPWIANNDDFAEFTSSQLVIFATYWVCTVITTVGYGDYFGTTTLEL